MESFFGGWWGGIAGVIVSHPLDVIRMRMALTSQSMAQTCKTMLKGQGSVMTFYAGVASPCLSVGAWKSATIGLQHVFLDFRARQRGIERISDLPMSDVFWASCFAGAASSTVLGPFELVKTRAAVTNAGMRDELRQLQQLGIKETYHSVKTIVLRDFFSTGVFLGVYETVQQALEKQYPGIDRVTGAMLAGAVGGPLGWVACYPLEVLRIRQAEHRNFHIWQDFVATTRRQGFSVWYRGCFICCLRSALQISSTMAVVEAIRKPLFPAESR
eukprot:TRINITY_DN47018_c0_g1_i1.p1 TRINITY_DN47018_c0_g1~~TRINITY_DN47018_c0_g1_i1.p1  ORF type:complete len:272 (+),score=53.00 TRINITY_DN47018_c0_g1_i1:66-881(+)